LPITETGYLSHFVAADAIDEAGGPVAYVVAWLDRAAQDKEWKSRIEAQRQLSLF
jgi:orotate phosphoribosyltransferase